MTSILRAFSALSSASAAASTTAAMLEEERTRASEGAAATQVPTQLSQIVASKGKELGAAIIQGAKEQLFSSVASFNVRFAKQTLAFADQTQRNIHLTLGDIAKGAKGGTNKASLELTDSLAKIRNAREALNTELEKTPLDEKRCLEKHNALLKVLKEENIRVNIPFLGLCDWVDHISEIRAIEDYLVPKDSAPPVSTALQAVLDDPRGAHDVSRQIDYQRQSAAAPPPTTEDYEYQFHHQMDNFVIKSTRAATVYWVFTRILGQPSQEVQKFIQNNSSAIVSNDEFNTLRLRIRKEIASDVAPTALQIQQINKRLFNELEELNKTHSRNYRNDIVHRKIQELTCNRFILIRPFIRLICYITYDILLWFSSICAKPLAKSIAERTLIEIRDGDTGHTEARYAAIQNWLRRGIRTFLSDYIRANQKMIEDKEGSGTKDDHLLAILTTPQFNHGLETQQLYDRATDILCEQMPIIRPIRRFIANFIKSQKLIDWLLNSSKEYIVDERGYTYAINQLFITILEGILQQLTKSESSDTPAKTHSKMKKKEIKEIIINLFKAIKLHNEKDLSGIEGVFRANPSFSFEKLVIVPLASTAANSVTAALEETLTRDRLTELAVKVSEIFNESFTPGLGISDETLNNQEKYVRDLSESILTAVSRQGVDGIFPHFTNSKIERKFLIEENAKARDKIETLIATLSGEIQLHQNQRAPSAAGTGLAAAPAATSAPTPPTTGTIWATKNPWENLESVESTTFTTSECASRLKTTLTDAIASFPIVKEELSKSTKIDENASSEIAKHYDTMSKLCAHIVKAIDENNVEKIKQGLEFLREYRTKRMPYILLAEPLQETTLSKVRNLLIHLVKTTFKDELEELHSFLTSYNTILFGAVHNLVMKPLVKAHEGEVQ